MGSLRASKLGIFAEANARPRERAYPRRGKGGTDAMQMKPIGWTKRRVQLECEHCSARTKVEWLSYVSALESGVPLGCRECGAEEVPRDRRQAVAAVVNERRAVVRT